VFRHLLVPIDGSVLSDGAVEKAVALATDLNARISFLYAKPDPGASVYGEAELSRAMDPEAFARRADAQADAILTRALTTAQAGGVACAALSRTAGEPYEAIIATAEERGCDLILMASHGHRGIKGLLLGSQTQKVLLHSKFPVLVYR
jgi:nucleotide-binding universal stress UspA family protein